MAGRIRTIKPELLENSRTAGLSSDAFRLYIGCILQADDFGNFYAHPGRLQAAIFWGSPPSRPITEILAEVSRESRESPAKPPLILLYEVAGEAYGSLTGWSDHQRVDKPGKPRVPGPDKADAPKSLRDKGRGNSSRDPRETLARPSRDPRETLAPDHRSPITGSSSADLREQEKEKTHACARVMGPGPSAPQGAGEDASTGALVSPGEVNEAWLDHAGGVMAPAGIAELTAALDAIAREPRSFDPILRGPCGVKGPADLPRAAIAAFSRLREYADPGYVPELRPLKLVERLADVQQILRGEKDPKAERDARGAPRGRPTRQQPPADAPDGADSLLEATRARFATDDEKRKRAIPCPPEPPAPEGEGLMTRELPRALEAEAHVVGSILLRPSALADVSDLVQPAHFLHPANAAIYRAMLELDGMSRPIDTVTLAEQMRVTATLERLRGVGDVSYFAEIMNGVVTTINVDHHAKLVADCAARRQTIEAAERAIELARAGDVGWQDDVESEILGAVEKRSLPSQETAKKLADRMYAQISARSEAPRETVGIRSGFPALDRLTLGLRDGLLYILAGRPGDGKTALGLNIATHVSTREQLPVLGFSLEMGNGEWMLRQLASEAHLDGTDLELGRLPEAQQWRQLAAARSRMAGALMVYDDQPSLTLRQIRSRARRWRASQSPGKSGLLLVDYLQLIDTEAKKGELEASAIGRVARGLKSLAKELCVPVVALAQLSRANESRTDTEPKLTDLRGSGEIEQNADVIAFLHAKQRTDDNQPTDLILRKVRGGRIGSVPLTFVKSQLRFEERAPEAPSMPRATGEVRATDDDEERYR